MAAATFAAISHGEKDYSPSGHYLQRNRELDAIERQLRRMKKAELIDFIMRHMGDDPELLDLIEEGDDD